MTRQPPEPNPISRQATAPTWAPASPDPDLEEATREDPSLASWMTSLAEQGRATMDDSLEERLYSQAPDALRQAGIEPAPEAIEAWVTAQLRRARP